MVISFLIFKTHEDAMNKFPVAFSAQYTLYSHNSSSEQISCLLRAIPRSSWMVSIVLTIKSNSSEWPVGPLLGSLISCPSLPIPSRGPQICHAASSAGLLYLEPHPHLFLPCFSSPSDLICCNFLRKAFIDLCMHVCVPSVVCVFSPI